MEPNLFLPSVFGLGILTEAYITLWQNGKSGALKHSFIIFGVLFLFLILAFTQGPNIFGAAAGLLLMALLMFVFYFSFAYRNEALPRINERILLPFTVLFWFIFLTLGGDFASSQLVLTLVSIPTIAVLYSSFTSGETGILSKIIFYLWFIFLSIIFLSFQASSMFSNIAHPENGVFLIGYLFLAGMVFLRLSVYVFTLFALFNLSNNRMGIKNDYPEIMVGKYSEEELPPWISALVIVGLGGGLILVHSLGVFPTELLITIAILGASHLAPTS